MAKIEFKGIDAYQKQIAALGLRETDKMLKYAIYPAAGMAKQEIEDATPVSDDPRSSGDLRASVVISPFRKDTDLTYTEVTFSGYDRKGVPNQLIARALESGRSTTIGKVGKHPFMRKTIERIRRKATDLMQDALGDYLNKVFRK